MLLCRIYNQCSEGFTQPKLHCLRFKVIFLCRWTVRKFRFLCYWILVLLLILSIIRFSLTFLETILEFSAHKWFASYLTGRKQRVLINDHTSDDFHLSCGIPQGSCMGPILFILYTSPLYHVIANHLPSAHGYADNTQLYLSFRPNGRSSQDQAIASVGACISDVRA